MTLAQAEGADPPYHSVGVDETVNTKMRRIRGENAGTPVLNAYLWNCVGIRQFRREDRVGSLCICVGFCRHQHGFVSLFTLGHDHVEHIVLEPVNYQQCYNLSEHGLAYVMSLLSLGMRSSIAREKSSM